MKTRVVIKRFLDYYSSLGAKVLPGGSLLDPAIPQTFVMSVGLSQFENGSRNQFPEGENQYVLSQNCFRHFDIEYVQKSQVHLSLFQMLGAFRFGSVERAIAIEQLWHLLVEVYRIDPNCLWVTYFAGDRISGCQIDADEESRESWLSVGLPAERVVGLGKDHNFWQQEPSTLGMEGSHKCGPYTEVFFDLGKNNCCRSDCRPGCQCGRFVEFSSILFISNWVSDDKSSTTDSLNLPFTETVLGVERSSMLVQGATSIFEIDTLRSLIAFVRSFPKRPSRESSSVGPIVSEQIIVDHVRAALFLTTDGAPEPGKGGRRRLMRILVRQVLTHMRTLGILDSNFLPSLVDKVIELYSDSHSSLYQGRESVLDYFETEASCFECTLKAAERQIERTVNKNGVHKLTGEQVLGLVKKHGMPFSLVELALARNNITFDEQEYRQAYQIWYQNCA